MPANLSAERQAVKQLAYHILHIIQANMRLPYTSLVASILLQHIVEDGILIGKMVYYVRSLSSINIYQVFALMGNQSYNCCISMFSFR